MNPLLALVPLATLLLLPSAILKFAAVICRIRVRWLHCFAFGVVVVIVSIAGRATSLYLWNPPFWLATLLAVGAYLCLGSWYVGSRGIGRDAKPIGRRGGLKLMLVYLALLASFIGAGFAVISMVRPT